jgi:hypothetical protein
MKFKVIMVFLLFCSCVKADRKQDIPKDELKETAAIKIDSQCVQKDIITPLGTKICYLNQDGKFKVSWENADYKRVYDSVYSCYYDKETGYWDFVPKFNSETKNTLVLTKVLYTSSGANPAPLEYSVLVLPKNKTDLPFERDFFITQEKDYLVYGDGKSNAIHLLNLETGKSQDEILYPSPVLSRSPTMSIHETKINKNSLFIKYESIDENDDIKIIAVEIKLKI